MKRFLSALSVTALLLLVCVSCDTQKPATRTFTALDTVCTLSLYDSRDGALLDACVQLVQEDEARWSRTVASSEIACLNAANGNPLTVSDDTYALLSYACEMARQTDGAFDVTTAPLTDLWKAAEKQDILPDVEELAKACSAVGTDKVMFGENNEVSLADGTSVDVGGIAKGVIADRVAAHMRENGCESALINLGGNVVALGGKPNGEPFFVGIGDPQNTEEIIATVTVRDSAVVTSGSYERGYMIRDAWFSHILHPQTGLPVSNDLLSVTILAPTAAQADALSTACFVMGYDRAQAFLTACEEVEAVFVKSDGTVTATDGVTFA